MLLDEWPGGSYPKKGSVTSLKINPRQHRSENLKYVVRRVARRSLPKKGECHIPEDILGNTVRTTSNIT